MVPNHARCLKYLIAATILAIFRILYEILQDEYEIKLYVYFGRIKKNATKFHGEMRELY